MQIQRLVWRRKAVVGRHDAVGLADIVDQTDFANDGNLVDSRREACAVKIRHRAAHGFGHGFACVVVERPAAARHVRSGGNPHGHAADFRHQRRPRKALPRRLAAAEQPQIASIPFRHGRQDFQRAIDTMEHAEHIDFFRIARVETAQRIAHQIAVAQFVVVLDRLAVRQAMRIDVQRQKALRRKRQETPFACGTDTRAMRHEDRGMPAFLRVDRPCEDAADRRAVRTICLQIKDFDDGIRPLRRQFQIHRDGIHAFALPLPECVEIIWNGQCRLDLIRLHQCADCRRGDSFSVQIRLETANVAARLFRLEHSTAEIRVRRIFPHGDQLVCVPHDAPFDASPQNPPRGIQKCSIETDGFA